MNPNQPEQGPGQAEQGRENNSAFDAEFLTLELAQQAESLIPQEGDSETALRDVAAILRESSDAAHLDHAQTVLEQNRDWSPATRELALEISQLDQRERRELPLTFEGAVDKLRGLGREDINLILPDLDSTDEQEVVSAIDSLLGVVEDMMGSFPEVEEAAGVDRAVLREYRAIRDALVQRKEELEILNQAEKEAYEEFDDDDDEDAARENVKKALSKSKGPSREQDLGNDQMLDDEKLLANLPDDEDELLWYENANFHLDRRDKEQVPYLKAFVRKRIQQASKEIPIGRYTGSVTDIMGEKGQALDFLRFVASKKLKGQLMSRGEFSKMSFSDVALTIGLNADNEIEDFKGRFAARR